MDDGKDKINEMLGVVRHNNRMLRANRNAQLMKKLFMIVVFAVTIAYGYYWYQANQDVIAGHITAFQNVVKQSEEILQQGKSLIDTVTNIFPTQES